MSSDASSFFSFFFFFEREIRASRLMHLVHARGSEFRLILVCLERILSGMGKRLATMLGSKLFGVAWWELPVLVDESISII